MIVWPGLRRSVSAIQRLFNGASFSAPLTHSLVPERGTGSATFTRATTKTVFGYGPTANSGDSQVLLTCAAGEAGFTGARRISEGVWSDTFADGSPIPASTLKGISIEGAGTNLCLQSQDLGTTWANSNQTVATNQIAAPDGTTTADKLTANAGSSAKESYQPIVVTAAAHTFSFFAKAGTASWVGCSFAGGEATTDGAFFNISSGVVGTVAAGTTASIAAYSDGWYRCSMTRTLSAGTSYAQVQVHTADNQARTWAAAGTENIYVWGAQVELGSFASSYIPTTTIAVARNADVLTYPSAGNVSATAGWVYAEFGEQSPGGGAAVREIVAIATDANNTIRIEDNSAGSVRLVNVTGGSTDVNSTLGAITAGWVMNKVAASYATNNYKGTLNTNAVVSDTSATVPAFTTIYVGDLAGSGGALFGTIRNVRIGQRALSSSELQAVTA